MYQSVYFRVLQKVRKDFPFYYEKYYRCGHCNMEYPVKLPFCPICFKENVKISKFWKAIRID
jgi:hypothetical protein